MLDTQTLREGGPKYLNFAGVTGWQLHRWYTSRRYCGRCGSPMVKDAKERMMFCPECHLMEYPKISPAVIIAVTDGNRILMSKYAGREYKKYALLAGFNEIGETIEETVKRASHGLFPTRCSWDSSASWTERIRLRLTKRNLRLPSGLSGRRFQ